MGGTDAAKAIDMHEGIPSTTIGLPARYIHSSAAIADLFDLVRLEMYLHIATLIVIKGYSYKEVKYGNGPLYIKQW